MNSRLLLKSLVFLRKRFRSKFEEFVAQRVYQPDSSGHQILTPCGEVLSHEYCGALPEEAAVEYSTLQLLL